MVSENDEFIRDHVEADSVAPYKAAVGADRRSPNLSEASREAACQRPKSFELQSGSRSHFQADIALQRCSLRKGADPEHQKLSRGRVIR